MAKRKSGIHAWMTGDSWKPSSPAPTPCWNTSTSIPYDAPTDSRLRMIAFTGNTIERKTSVSMMRLSARISPSTIGRKVLVSSTKSTVSALCPPTKTPALVAAKACGT